MKSVKYTLYAHDVVLSAFNKRRIEEKVGRLEKYLRHPFPIEITFRREGKGLILCAVTYGEDKHVVHVERSNHSLDQSLDEVLAAFRRELIKQRQVA